MWQDEHSGPFSWETLVCLYLLSAMSIFTLYYVYIYSLLCLYLLSTMSIFNLCYVYIYSLLCLYLIFAILVRLQSQSEFCMTDDIGNTDTVKTKTRDPKRPKSPRLMRSSSTDQLTPRPGDLER